MSGNSWLPLSLGLPSFSILGTGCGRSACRHILLHLCPVFEPWWLLCCRLVFAYQILTPAALQFFVSYADGAVESLWSIDQYFEFVLVLLLSTGLSFQVCPYCSMTVSTDQTILQDGAMRLWSICLCFQEGLHP